MQGISEMHDIPKMRNLSAFAMVMNLIIGSLLMIFWVVDKGRVRRRSFSAVYSFRLSLLLMYFCGSLIPKSLSRAQAFYIMADRLT